jgi:hypothetical protein
MGQHSTKQHAQDRTVVEATRRARGAGHLEEAMGCIDSTWMTNVPTIERQGTATRLLIQRGNRRLTINVGSCVHYRGVEVVVWPR